MEWSQGLWVCPGWRGILVKSLLAGLWVVRSNPAGILWGRCGQKVNFDPSFLLFIISNILFGYTLVQLSLKNSAECFVTKFSKSSSLIVRVQSALRPPDGSPDSRKMEPGFDFKLRTENFFEMLKKLHTYSEQIEIMSCILLLVLIWSVVTALRLSTLAISKPIPPSPLQNSL
jgi:hypothetical protein